MYNRDACMENTCISNYIAIVVAKSPYPAHELAALDVFVVYSPGKFFLIKTKFYGRINLRA